MPWVAITTNDVLAVLNSSELTTYQQFRPAAGQADPLATIIGHVTTLAQGYIRRRHQLDAGGGIPASLVGDAAAIVAYRLLLRCGAKTGLEPRKQAHDDAMKTLERVGNGEIGVEAPVNPTAEITSAPAPSIVRPHRRPGNYVGDNWGDR